MVMATGAVVGGARGRGVVPEQRMFRLGVQCGGRFVEGGQKLKLLRYTRAALSAASTLVSLNGIRRMRTPVAS